MPNAPLGYSLQDKGEPLLFWYYNTITRVFVQNGRVLVFENINAETKAEAVEVAPKRLSTFGIMSKQTRVSFVWFIYASVP